MASVKTVGKIKCTAAEKGKYPLFLGLVIKQIYPPLPPSQLILNTHFACFAVFMFNAFLLIGTVLTLCYSQMPP